MNISQANLPDNSGVLTYVYDVAIGQVLRLLQQISPQQYTQAVYNLAGDYLINAAPDQGSSTFFEDLRTKWGCQKFQGGVVASAGDEVTSTSIEIVESLKLLTVADLQNLKTPYGRVYFGIAQQFGTVWGLS